MAVSYAIDMLQKIGCDGSPHGVQHDIDAFPTRKLDGRHEISVGGYEHNLVDLALVRHGSYVQPKAHIHAFLDHIQFEILVARRMAFAPTMDCVWP